MNKINVYSEIGKLKTILLQKPGREVENLTPDLLERMLYDDIPFLKVARQEHEYLVNRLEENGVKVLYISNLTAEALEQNPHLREKFIDKFINEAKVEKKWVLKYKEYLLKMNNLDMISEMIAGTKKITLDKNDKSNYPFITDPLPNISFQRDPFSSVGNGIVLNKMWSVTRNRETLFPDFVFQNHKDFKDNINFWYTRNEKESIEGGDVLVLNEEILIIGISQRTTMKAINNLSKNLFNKSSFKKIIAIDLPKQRKFMHLDTVLTNIDYGKFLVHPLIFDTINEFSIFEITKSKVVEIKKSLVDVLSDLTKTKVQLIKCGGDDPIAAGREQWNDGTNVLTISPGVVIAYERNWVTNELLRKSGIKVIEMPSGELSRARGGPRCLSMPLYRE